MTIDTRWMHMLLLLGSQDSVAVVIDQRHIHAEQPS